MEQADIDLLKNGKYTKYYINLVNTVNNKLENKIETLSSKIIDEFESKKIELLKMKSELDELYKMKSEINSLNAFYELTDKKNLDSLIQSIPFVPIENPYKSSSNLLTELTNVSITTVNGELIKKNYKTHSLEFVKPEDLKNSDAILSSYSRLIFKKANTIKPLDNNKVIFESNASSIVIDFLDNKVNPSHIFCRYFFLPNENKYTYSYINTVLGSNDGKTWELLSQNSSNDIKYFEKLSIFKWNVLNKKKTDNFYRFLSLEVLPIREVINTNQVNKYINKLNIPISGLEIYGDYTTNLSKGILENIDSNFEDFFNTYLQINQVELSSKIELQLLLKIILDSFKEFNNIVTNVKSQILVQQILNNSSNTNNKNTSNNTSSNTSNSNILESTDKEQLSNNTLLLNMSEELKQAELEEENRYLNDVSREINRITDLKFNVETECKKEYMNLKNNETIKKLLEDEELDVDLPEEQLPSNDNEIDITKEIHIGSSCSFNNNLNNNNTLNRKTKKRR